MIFNNNFKKMQITRDSSYTLCKGLIKEVYNRNKNIKSININILEISEINNSIKVDIKIDNKLRTFDILLEKRKINKNSISLSNLKNQKTEIILKNDNNKEVNLKNGEILENKINVVNNINNNESIEKQLDNINKIENENINKISMNEKQDNINLNCNNNEEDIIYDESEPVDEYDYKDPHFKKYPHEFRCYDCYETNVEKAELFEYAQNLIYEFNDLKDENKKLNDEIINKNKQIKLLNNDEIDINFIKTLNDKFMNLLMIMHKSFNNIGSLLTTLEKANPKKVPDLLNKNISSYRKQMQNIADEADKIQIDYIEINKEKFGDKIIFKE